MEWKKRDSGKTVLDVVMHNSGMTQEELTHPKTIDANQIENLSTAADTIKKCILNKIPISIMGDYDVDGITSSAILYSSIKKLGTTPVVRLPRRYSEGYGLSANAINEFTPGLLITVDNGIAANDAIQTAKEKGFMVIIIDHHLPGEQLPNADIIVDPHVNPSKNAFTDYCGAGLAFKLAQLLHNDTAFLNQMCCYAAVGTIADSMPLKGDNRYIVMQGLSLIRQKRASLGLNKLFEIAEVYSFTAKDIGFKIGPMLNAAGRMYDEGAMISFEALIAETENEAQEKSTRLLQINEERKTSTTRGMEYVEDIIAMDCLYGEAPLVVFAEGMKEGIVGIITGRLAEKYRVPAFVFTDSEVPGVLKGSGRTYGDVNLKEDVVDAVMPLLLKGGGHAAAAGISVLESNYQEMVQQMQKALSNYVAKETNIIEYDLEISSKDVPATIQKLSQYEPYGEGNPEPIFKISNVTLTPKQGSVYKLMGKVSAEHIKLFSATFSAVCFGRANDYKEMGCPYRVDLVGTLSKNVFRFASELQLETIDFRPAAVSGRVNSSLLDALKANGTI